jgi:hypothetical protein
MKISWKDAMTTLFALVGGAVVYAKFYSFSWAMVGSWRSAVALLILAGILMFAFSSFDFDNYSILNVSEMVMGLAAIVLAIIGVIVVSQTIFYTLAVVLGVFWLADTARHVRHSIIGHTPISHHQASAH